MDYQIHVDALSTKISDLVWMIEYRLRKEEIFDRVHVFSSSFQSDDSGNSINPDIFVIDPKGNEIFSAINFPIHNSRKFIGDAIKCIKWKIKNEGG